jgi:GxxExxY protein
MELLYEDESYKIRGAAFEVYKQLGCKHKEVVFQRAYYEALAAQKLEVVREKQIPLYFNGKKVGSYTPDFIIADKILIEIKAKEFVTKQDIDQFWQYLKAQIIN